MWRRASRSTSRLTQSSSTLFILLFTLWRLFSGQSLPVFQSLLCLWSLSEQGTRRWWRPSSSVDIVVSKHWNRLVNLVASSCKTVNNSPPRTTGDWPTLLVYPPNPFSNQPALLSLLPTNLPSCFCHSNNQLLTHVLPPSVLPPHSSLIYLLVLLPYPLSF